MRGLVSTLLANAEVADPHAPQGAGGQQGPGAGAGVQHLHALPPHQGQEERQPGQQGEGQQGLGQQGEQQGQGQQGLGQQGGQQGRRVAAAGVAAAAAAGGILGLRGFSPLVARGCRGTDLVWWDAMQPRMAMADPALSRCAV